VVIVIQSVVGNVMIRYAQLYATQYASVQNAKFIARRLSVPSARFIATSHSAMFVAPRISVRRRIVLNVRLSAHQPTAALNVRHQMLFVHQCARPPNVTGSARSQSLALNQNASLCASVQHVIPVPVRLVPRVVAAIALTKLTWLLPFVLLTHSWRSHLRLHQ